MLPVRVVLCDTSKSVPFTVVSRVAAALNLQAQRDFGPIWNVRATVAAAESPQHVPLGTWPVFLVAQLPKGMGGVHLTQHKQPYALVEVGSTWPVAASHETLEMLADPSGNALHASQAIAVRHGRVVDAPGKFEYLIEVCDPSEADPFAYVIDDVPVSDFYTPNYFDPTHAAGVRYSFTGAIKRPRDVLRGGYLSWFNAAKGTMQQLRNHTDRPSVYIKDLGKPKGRSLRSWIDGVTQPTKSLSHLDARSGLARRAAERHEALAPAQADRAKLYRVPR